MATQAHKTDWACLGSQGTKSWIPAGAKQGDLAFISAIRAKPPENRRKTLFFRGELKLTGRPRAEGAKNGFVMRLSKKNVGVGLKRSALVFPI
jgi:hypothetical protein